MEREFKDRTIVPSKDGKKRSYRKVLISTAIALPLLLTFAWVSYRTDFFKNTSYSNLNPFAAKETISSIMKTEDTKPVSENALKANAVTNDTAQQPQQEEISFEENPSQKVAVELKDDTDKTFVKTPVTEKAFDISGKHYFIIGGCFEVAENSERFLQLLKEKGYPAAKLEKLGRLTPVCYNGFASKEEATAELARIKSSDPNVWLMTR